MGNLKQVVEVESSSSGAAQSEQSGRPAASEALLALSMNKRREAALNKLREPFPDNLVSYKPQRLIKAEEYDKLPKGECKICGGYHATSKTGHLSYVGHAAVTKRLLDADPEWSWEPAAFDANGEPHFDQSGGLWIRLTVAGVTRLGYGHNEVMKYSEIGSRPKAVIGDAIRNAAMRFGVALEEWHKGELGLPDPAFIHGLGWGGLDEQDEPKGKPAIEMPAAKDAGSVHLKSGGVVAPEPVVAKPAEAQPNNTPVSEALAEPGEVKNITMKLAALKQADPDKLILDTIGIPSLEGLTKANFLKLKEALKGKK